MSSFGGGGVEQQLSVLIIDPQNDFYFDAEGIIGSLPVVGSKGDIERICNMLDKNNTNIAKINVSLDTHSRKHIANRTMWKITAVDGDTTHVCVGQNPPSVTLVTYDEVTNQWSGKPLVDAAITDTVQKVLLNKKLTIEPRLEKLVDEIVGVKSAENGTNYDAHIAALNKWFIYYYTQVKKGNGLTLWEEHCIEETPGHSVVESLKTKLDRTPEKVTYHIKGQNCLVEMFSIMKADVVFEEAMNDFVEENEIIKKYIYTGSEVALIPTETSENESQDTTDHVYLNTGFNEKLFKDLIVGNNPIVICGEALTHCVLNSFKDIVNEFKKPENAGKTNQIWLVANGASPIDGTRWLAKPSYDELERFDKEEGGQNRILYKKINEDGSLSDITYEKFLEITTLNIDDSTPTSTAAAVVGGRRSRCRKQKKTKKTRRARRSRKSCKRRR
jgi:nicotinamidase-related amidase